MRKLNNIIAKSIFIASLLYNPIQISAQALDTSLGNLTNPNLTEQTSETEAIQNNNPYSESKNITTSLTELLSPSQLVKKSSSYSEFVKNAKTFPLDKKIGLLSGISSLLYYYNYEILMEKVLSQDLFFEKLQDSLYGGENSVGACGAISTHVEKLANDLGIRSAAVGGVYKNKIKHAYILSKTDNGLVVINGPNIFKTNTKNTKKALEKYQKHNKVLAFQHPFFEDSKFKYRLITEDGRNFLNFTGYDESSNPLKETLTQKKSLKENPKTEITLEKNLISTEINSKDLFIKTGEIKGASNSPMEEINLFQIGYENNFLLNDVISIFPKSIKVNPKASIFYGNVSQCTDIHHKNIFGIQGNLIISNKNDNNGENNNNKNIKGSKKGGFNFSSRIGGEICSGGLNPSPNTFLGTLFYDFNIGIGISYKFLSLFQENKFLTPYILGQSNLFRRDLGPQKFKQTISEVEGGIITGIESSNKKVSLNPYYLWKPWEDELGVKTKLSLRNFKYFKDLGFNAKASLTKSKYEFNPDKNSYEAGGVF